MRDAFPYAIHSYAMPPFARTVHDILLKCSLDLANEEIDPVVDHFVLFECNAIPVVAVALRDFRSV